MATSTLFKSTRIDTKEKAQNFADAIIRAENDKHDFPTGKYKIETDKDVIRTIVKKAVAGNE